MKKKMLMPTAALGLALLFAACEAGNPSASDASQTGQPAQMTTEIVSSATAAPTTTEAVITTEAAEATSDAVETAAETEASEGTPMDADAYAALCAMLEDDSGWPCRALIAEYATPEEIDLYELFYDGLPNENNVLTEAEQTFLNEHWSELDLDLRPYRFPTQEINTVLQEYFGLTLDQTNEKGLELLTYNEDTDCYYQSHGDCHYITVKPTGAYVQKDGSVKLYYQQTGTGMDTDFTKWVATLQPVEDGYRFVSNVPLEPIVR